MPRTAGVFSSVRSWPIRLSPRPFIVARWPGWHAMMLFFMRIVMVLFFPAADI